MNDKEIRSHSFYKYAKDVREFCKPLFTNTPINHFYIARIYNNGDYSGLMSDPAWAEFYLKHNLMELGINQLFSFEQKGCGFWNSSTAFPTNKKAKILVEGGIELKRACGVGIIVSKSQEYNELCVICSDHDPHSNDPFLIENVPLLKKFVLYAKEQIYTDRFLTTAFLKRYKNKVIKNAYDIPKKNAITFPVKKYYLDGAFDSIAFSRREVECLRCIYDGRTAKQIARLLKLSPRTIESHRENIKKKTGSRNLQELRKKLESCFLLDAIELN